MDTASRILGHLIEQPVVVSCCDDENYFPAHTTQFTKPGWRYLKHGAGVGTLKHGGSYVALMSPDTKDFTLVVETVVSSVLFFESDLRIFQCERWQKQHFPTSFFVVSERKAFILVPATLQQIAV